MKKPRVGPRLHSLEVPLDGITLIVPSAAVAEVINPLTLTPVPFGQPWLKGVFGWRTLAVPVISFEALVGMPEPASTAAGKIVIFYPLRGRADWEFYGMFATAEPRPQALSQNEPVASDSELPKLPCIAAGLKVGGKLMLIPDIDEIKKVFYPA
jgi:chemosensory pili system protein ChpC